MSETLVKVENVSKKFCRNLKRSLWYGMKDLGSELIGKTAHREGKLRKDEFWAVNDVSFELKRGECLGLIGRNGAGKTTLLRMLNGLIKPDSGRIEMHGRVGALIALGAGFNPILTGRENIYVNAAVLGLAKKEIAARFDEIVAFAELDEFIDAPVQSYSSGMQVRLGFAVAATLNPDVLLLDEILAVGDIGFRAKCYHTIGNLLKTSAVIFVSHSMPLVAKVAQTAMVLNNGHSLFQGPTSNAILKYFDLFTDKTDEMRMGNGEAFIESFIFDAPHRNNKCAIEYGSPLKIRLTIKALKKVDDLIVNVVFRSMAGEVIAECNNYIEPFTIGLEKDEKKTIEIRIAEITLNPAIYKIALALMSSDMVVHYDWIRTSKEIEVSGPNIATAGQQFRAKWQAL
jgi:lipopolysaccharide transport system ATP-binding protein